jgi:hypothetical protein
LEFYDKIFSFFTGFKNISEKAIAFTRGRVV